ncbi:MAG TPA: site-specific tyrosine recombinase XerD [Cryomorphaceae bacterium]|jgi:integrase/recombinase XerD|nr:site-specific tyrosine recombinase XerD [Cryomorphaceae bacterium]
MNWTLAHRQFLTYLRLERGLSANTLQAYKSDLSQLQIWAEEIDKRPVSLMQEDLRAFLQHQAKQGKSPRTQMRMQSSMRAFYLFLLEENVVEKSPMEGIESPSLGRKLPVYLTVEEVDALIQAIDRSHSQGERDLAMLEVLYACGLRVSELVDLKMEDVFEADLLIRVVGKGNKERIVPMYASAMKSVCRYRDEVRVHVPIQKGAEGFVFLNQRGKPLSRVWVFKRLRVLAQLAGIAKTIGPHTLRHTFATHLIQRGADIRIIQMLLGHESITTTEIYTHLEQQQLRDTVLRYHPKNL